MLWGRRTHSAINQRSGGNTADRTVDQVMATGDAATQTHVLSSLYAAMRSSPAPIDVADLFRQLGVTERNGAIVYDDGAPLAGIRIFAKLPALVFDVNETLLDLEALMPHFARIFGNGAVMREWLIVRPGNAPLALGPQPRIVGQDLTVVAASLIASYGHSS